MPQTEQIHDTGSARRRDRGLRRVKLTTLATAVAAATGSVVLGTAYATALPGASTVSTRTPPPATATPPGTKSSSAPGTSPSSAPSTGLQPPAQAPTVAPTTQAPQPVQTTSGGS